MSTIITERHVLPKVCLTNVPISLITAIFYNKIITNGYCFDPHLPQNFAVGFSVFPQLLQDEDVGLVSADFGLGSILCLDRCWSSYSSRSCLLGFVVVVPLAPLLTAKTIPITAAPIAAAPPAIYSSGIEAVSYTHLTLPTNREV